MYSAKESKRNTNQVSVNTLLQPQRISGSTILSPARASSSAPRESFNRVLVVSDPSSTILQEVPAEGTLVNQIGVVVPEANLRPSPSTANQPLRLLEFNTRLQIIKEVSGGWYYISTEDGDTGYVAAHLVKKGMPEPGARLHKVTSGESAIGIAEKYYKNDATQWGQDLRFFINVLVYANQGAGNLDKGISTAKADDSWREAKVKSGYYIWIPSVAYAQSLKDKVASGSISYGIKDGINNTINYLNQKIEDFNYANQFVIQLLPEKLSSDLLVAIKSALISFAISMVAAGLLLAIAAGLGALIGALIGFFAGGVGAAPGAALGAKIGFEIGLFLLKWIGLGLLIAYGAFLLGNIGVAFGKYVIAVWQANGDRKELEASADLCAEAIKEFLLGVLELIIMLVAAWGMGRAMAALAKTKFGHRIGYDKLAEWVNKRNKMETTKETLETVKSEGLLKSNLLSEANCVSAGGSKLHPNVPEWQAGDPARGVFKVGGIEVPLQSGAKGPGEYLKTLPGGRGSGLNAQIPTHVEGHVAGIMHKYGINQAELFINKAPCGTGAMCRHNLHRILPPGAKLLIHFLETNGKISTWLFESGVPGWRIIK